MVKETKAPEKVEDPQKLVEPPIVAQPEKVEDTSVQATDKTVPGGKYIVDGRLVDCNGNPIKE